MVCSINKGSCFMGRRMEISKAVLSARTVNTGGCEALAMEATRTLLKFKAFE